MDPSSGFCFSDATNPDQLVLFEIDETPKLASSLTKAFVGRQVPVEQIQQYVEDETPFIATHMRAALRLLEDEEKIAVSEYKLDGKKRRGKTYPERVVIEFR